MNKLPKGVEIVGPLKPGYEKILTAEALAFLAKLVRKHAPTRSKLLAYRVERQRKIDAGKLPGFLPETKKVRSGQWQIKGIPADLQDRRVEITGPVDRKMVINALNAGAKCFMADFEDSQAPTWDGLIQGQLNLRATPCAAPSRSPRRKARATSSTRRLRHCWCARAAGTCPRSTC